MKYPAALLLPAAFLLLAAAPARAGIDDIRWLDNGAGIALGAKDFKYGEDVGGTTFDTESGWIPSAAVDAGMLLSPANEPLDLFDNLYLHFNGQIGYGQTHYNGGLQNTLTHIITPYQSTTHDNFFATSIQAGRAFPLFDQLMLIPYGDLGYRSWHRGLTGIGAYTEDYSNSELETGLLAQWSPFAQWVFALSGAAGATVGAQMQTGGVAYGLGTEAIWQMDGKVSYAITQNFDIDGTLGFTGFGYGHSAVINGAYEPDSYTHETTLLMGFGYHWE